ncbi:hypothetical protein HZB04_01315 [Candidatus Wolfebacteria bacterium]|nr:hypothetical protein [Candidatus Wolfebacteria bacterium]
MKEFIDSYIINFEFKIDEKGFSEDINYLNKLPFAKFLSSDIKDKLHSLWVKSKKDIRLMEIAIRLKNGSFNFINFSKLSTVLEEFSIDEINETLQVFGFNNLEEYINFIKKEVDYRKEKFIKTYNFINNIFEEKNKILMEKRKIFRNDYENEIKKSLFGFDIDKKINELKKMCDNKGIEHKDFKHRNILIEWDFNKNKPLIKRGDKEPKLFLIDWEPKSKTPLIE